jgi:hypothetical protein
VTRHLRPENAEDDFASASFRRTFGGVQIAL